MSFEQESTRNSVRLAHEKEFSSIALPLIEACSGRFNQKMSKAIMLEELGKLDVPMIVKVVVFKRAALF